MTVNCWLNARYALHSVHCKRNNCNSKEKCKEIHLESWNEFKSQVCSLRTKWNTNSDLRTMYCCDSFKLRIVIKCLSVSHFSKTFSDSNEFILSDYFRKILFISFHLFFFFFFQSEIRFSFCLFVVFIVNINFDRHRQHLELLKPPLFEQKIDSNNQNQHHTISDWVTYLLCTDFDLWIIIHSMLWSLINVNCSVFTVLLYNCAPYKIILSYWSSIRMKMGIKRIMPMETIQEKSILDIWFTEIDTISYFEHLSIHRSKIQRFQSPTVVQFCWKIWFRHSIQPTAIQTENELIQIENDYLSMFYLIIEGKMTIKLFIIFFVLKDFKSIIWVDWMPDAYFKRFLLHSL